MELALPFKIDSFSININGIEREHGMMSNTSASEVSKPDASHASFFSPTYVDPVHTQQYNALRRQYPNGKPLGDYFHFGADKDEASRFSDEEVAHILKEYKDYPTVEGRVDDTIDTSYRSSNIKWIPRTPHTEWLYRKLFSMISWAQEQWGFDVTCLGEQIQIAKYDHENMGSYDYHVDAGSGASSLRKISMSVQLSDPSECSGGELTFRSSRHDRVAPKTKGCTIAFPSTMLHAVSPVTRGCRYSLVLWASGPPFR
jgi:PKHD-type hydroxylase